jgi:hypothetical protein
MFMVVITILKPYENYIHLKTNRCTRRATLVKQRPCFLSRRARSFLFIFCWLVTFFARIHKTHTHTYCSQLKRCRIVVVRCCVARTKKVMYFSFYIAKLFFFIHSSSAQAKEEGKGNTLRVVYTRQQKKRYPRLFIAHIVHIRHQCCVYISATTEGENLCEKKGWKNVFFFPFYWELMTRKKAHRIKAVKSLKNTHKMGSFFSFHFSVCSFIHSLAYTLDFKPNLSFLSWTLFFSSHPPPPPHANRIFHHLHELHFSLSYEF